MSYRDRKYCLYSITCLINGKVYMGVTNSYLKRVNSHQYELNKNNHRNRFLQEDYNRYGEESFYYDLISNYPSKIEALRIEKYYTDCIFGLSQNLCYNIVSGGVGSGLVKRIKSHIKPISEETREKLKERSRNQKQTLKTRQKRIKTLSGANCYAAKKVIDEATGKIYNCIKEAAPLFGIKYGTLVQQLRGVMPNKTTLRYLN